MSTAAKRRAYSGPALFSRGFRPFFLMGAARAAISVPIWAWSYLLGSPVAAHRDWHIHKMLFGFMGGVVVGFLTTAVPNWTGRMPVVGRPLAALAGLWLAGRVAMLAQFAIGPAAAVIDSAFLLVFAAVVWREVLAGNNRRNLPVCALVTLLAVAPGAATRSNGSLINIRVSRRDVLAGWRTTATSTLPSINIACTPPVEDSTARIRMPGQTSASRSMISAI